MKKIGFIGTGIMGKSMVRNLMKKGYQVSVYNRTKERAQELIDEGAEWRESVKDCVREQDIVITIVGYPKDVEEVYFGGNGILENASPEAYLIDMTTTSPKLAVKIYEEAKKRGMKALDAPVTGGDSGAKAGTLTILVGGEKEDFEACRAVFEAMGSKICYEGKAGNGQHTKMCNQIAIAGAISGACEALAYAKAVGLDVNVMMDSISSGAAGSAQLSNVASRILKDDLEPGFFLKHFIKDMSLASEEADEAGVSLGVLKYVLSMYQELDKRGMGDLGTQALISYYPYFEEKKEN
ncbi:MAG: NAD(P)-dependent oxidoreductase [bacterium]|nr:NAD(P)-dependent oxidoreductase [bacterium]